MFYFFRHFTDSFLRQFIGRLKARSSLQRLAAWILFLLCVVTLNQDFQRAGTAKETKFGPLATYPEERVTSTSEGTSPLEIKKELGFTNIELVSLVKETPPNALSYSYEPAPSSEIILKPLKFVWGWNKNLHPLDFLTRYFALLRTPSGHCRKLATLGGKMECRFTPNGTRYHTKDGHKVIAFFLLENFRFCLMVILGF